MAQVRGIVQEGLGSSKRLQQLLGSLALPPQTLETLCSIHLPSPGSLEEFLGLQHRVHDALELLLGVELIRAAEMQPTPRLATCPHRLGGGRVDPPSPSCGVECRSPPAGAITISHQASQEQARAQFHPPQSEQCDWAGESHVHWWRKSLEP